MSSPASARQSTLALSALLLCLATTSRAYLSIPYNTSQHFGPDGPWQAVAFDVKYPSDTDYSTVNVYPGNLYDTIAALYVPTPQACRKDTTGTCAVGGTVEPLAYSNGSSWYTYSDDKTGYYMVYNGSTAYMDAQLPGGISFTSAIIDVCRVAQTTYPNGNIVAAEVGLAGLGGSPLATSLNAPLALYTNGLTQSNTFGLHIGAAQFNYAGSLIFGGYDRGRVIGPVLSFDAHSALGLLDIGIGVEDGESPFAFESKQELLVTPDSAGVTQPISSYLKPEYPYIYLPQQTIEAIADNLPVKFDTGSGYWLWDTSDPMYQKVVGGAGYLGFTFPSLTGSSTNETIKVPFALLNLTLETSVSGLDSDVPYFPVMEAHVSQLDNYPILLGRAFMQATFTGTNWNTNISWLAQAPGPGASREGLGYDPVDIDANAKDLDVPAGDALFKQSWAGHWNVINSTASQGYSSDESNGGLSGGAIAGIVIAAVVVIAIIAAIIWFVMRRKKKQRDAAAWPQPTTPAYEDDKHGPAPTYAHYGEPQHSVNELDAPVQSGTYKPVPQQETWHEVDGGNTGFRSELPGHGPAELPTSHYK